MLTRMLMLILSGLASLSLAFAPAPVYKPPKEADLLKQMQGTWELESNSASVRKGIKIVRRSLFVRIKGDRWTYIFSSPENGSTSEGTPVQIILDARQNPVAMDHKLYNPGPGVNPFVMRGLVKLDGDLLSICYSPGTFARRPAKFERRQPKFGENSDKDISPMTMTFKRVK